VDDGRVQHHRVRREVVVKRWSIKRTVLLAATTCTLGCQSDKAAVNKFDRPGFFQQTQASVEEALRIEPKVESMPDPTSLGFDSGPVKPNLHLTAAAVMEQNGELDAAHEHYRKALEMEPSSRPALIGIARLHHRAGKLNEAIAAYQHAARTVGNDPVILNDLALCLTHARRHPEAIETLRAAVAAKPDSLLYRNNLAAVLVEANRADEAVQVLAEKHGLAVAHYNVGYLLNRHGQPTAASAHFTHSLRVNPSFEPARAMLDRVLPEVGRPAEPRVANGLLPSSSASHVPTTSGSPAMAAPTRNAPAMGIPTTSTTTTVVPAMSTPATPASVQHPAPVQSHGAVAPVSLWTSDTAAAPVQPAEFEHSLDVPSASAPSAAAEPVDVAQLPPIRLPASVRTRHASEGVGRFVAPAPAGL
jgi:Tfp pilus assembly protein PilF